MIPLARIGPRYYWNRLITYERPFDPDNNLDDNELVATIEQRGIQTPVIVFMDHTGEMHLVSGGRRLAALKHVGVDKLVHVPCHVLQTDHDGLVNALIEEAKDGPSQTLYIPMKPSEKLQLGMIVRGWGAYMRRHFRRLDGTTLNYNMSADDYYLFLDIKRGEWPALKQLACAYVAYESRAMGNEDPDKAREVLATLDTGAITIHQARGIYTSTRTTRSQVAPASKKVWLEQTFRLSQSLSQLVAALLDYQAIPTGVDEPSVEELRAQLCTARNKVTAMVKSLDHRLAETKQGGTPHE